MIQAVLSFGMIDDARGEHSLATGGSLGGDCAGDCNADNSVTVDELIRGVSIALGSLGLDMCPVFDTSEDSQVTVDEIVAAVTNALNGCPVVPTPTPGDTFLSGLIEAESFTLPAGTRALVTDDLIIRTTGDVDIDGDLEASHAGGQSIVIDAGGSISIGGDVVAGSGQMSTASSLVPRGPAQNNDGGDIVIQSDEDIVVAASANVSAGDGMSGGTGGDVVLQTPNSGITIEGHIHVGNGGDGAAVHEDAAVPGGLQDLDNGGGDSGVLILNATTVGPGFVAPTAVNLVQPYASDVGGLLLPAGEDVFITTSPLVLSGGQGGDAGAFDSGLNAGGTAPSGQISVVITRRGARGGDGFLAGGAGSDVVVRGLAGMFAGADGQSIAAVGGDGGGCPALFDQKLCEPGPGGDAEAIGGNGAPGAVGGGAGGDGGDASALGGNSLGDADEPETVMVYGLGGDADATAGDGGDGGNACPPQANNIGGIGGDGGSAAAAGGNGFMFIPNAQRGFTMATGGDGGDGGDGMNMGGAGGAGGSANFLRDVNALRMGAEAVQGLGGVPGGICPVAPTPTPTQSPASTPLPTSRARVAIVTGAGVGTPSKPVMSLGTPIISQFSPPSGWVLVTAQLGTNDLDQTNALLRLNDTGTRRVLLAQGQVIPDANGTMVDSISSPNAKFQGNFALVQTTFGGRRTVVEITDDGVIVPVLGVGAPGQSSFLDPRSYLLGGAVLSEAVDVFNKIGIVVIIPPLSPIDIVKEGGTFPYANSQGKDVNGTVTDVSMVDPVFGQSGGGTSRITVDGSTEILFHFSYSGTGLEQVLVGPTQGNRAPGFGSEVNLAEFRSGIRMGGIGGRGFAALLAGAEIDVDNDEAVFVSDSTFRFPFVLQEGTAVPDRPGAVFGTPQAPVMGPQDAAVLHEQISFGTRPAIGLVNYAAISFRTVVVAGEAAPGGGVFADFPPALAINEAGLLVFLAELEAGGSAYFVANTSNPAAPLRRVIGTGDSVQLGGGETAVIAGLGMIPATAGLGGEASAVNNTHMALTATLDDDRQVVLVVALGP